MEMEEQILAEGCREGEDTARRELYDRYAARLLAVCLRYSGDRATAEDLMHDAFLKIYGAFDRFSYRGPGSLRAWIERIAVNVALEWLRNRNKLNFRTLDEGRALPAAAKPPCCMPASVPVPRREIAASCWCRSSLLPAPKRASTGNWEMPFPAWWKAIPLPVWPSISLR